ncbi:hypothetical protein TGPRC2_358250 [Toxoplasma gondii TgCatPRC2]|uniref:Uncharacterized protein n=1 Tax=Toxoplasma gondii TgCatPRC2 TaxID=1130821 RepID=A0A151HBR6_TOXGO|nr:hypothetical protein TGPRC2_358250 [Toxoplasma gondii TgCatPRC2]
MIRTWPGTTGFRFVKAMERELQKKTMPLSIGHLENRYVSVGSSAPRCRCQSTYSAGEETDGQEEETEEEGRDFESEVEESNAILLRKQGVKFTKKREDTKGEREAPATRPRTDGRHRDMDRQQEAFCPSRQAATLGAN